MRQLNLWILGAPTVDEHGATEQLHQFRACRFGQRRRQRGAIAARRFAELDLDELVLLERRVERSDEPFGEPVLAHVHHRIEMVPERAQKASLLAGQHTLEVAHRWSRYACARS